MKLLGVLALSAFCALCSSQIASVPCPLDVIVILDISGSIEEEFTVEKGFAEKIIDRLPENAFNDDTIQMGLITFAGSANVLVSLREVSSKSSLLAALGTVTSVGGSTSAVSAIRLAVPEIENYKREDSQLIVVHVSDGNSLDAFETLKAESQKLKDTGAFIFAVTFSEDAYLPELNAITGDARQVYTGDNAVSNFATGFIEVATDDFCSLAAPKVVPDNVNECKIDLIFVFDTSGSVEEDFEYERVYLENIAAFPDAATYADLSVAVVTFDTVATVALPFKVGRSKDEVVQFMKDIKFTGGGTSAVAGETAAIEEITKNHRSDAILIVVHMSDGNSGASDTYSLLKETADSLHATGANVFAVTQSEDYYLPELKRYAGSEDRVYVLGDSERFKEDIIAIAYPSSCTTPVGSCPVSLMILLDRSGSVTDVFEKERDFAAELVDLINPEQIKANVKSAVVSFNNQASVDLKFSDSNKKADLIAAIKGIESTGGSTSAVSGMNAMINELKSKSKVTDERLVVMHISDGNSQDFLSLTQSTSDALKDTGAEVWATTFSRDFYKPELEIITRNERRIYTDDTGRDKFKTNFVRVINSDQCLRAVPVEKPNVNVCLIDLVINLDISGSVEEDFVNERAFVLRILNTIKEESFLNDKIRILLITFTTEAKVVIPFSQKLTQAEAIKALEDIEFEGGGTSALSAIKLDLEQIALEHRPDARLITLHLSDGNSGASDDYADVDDAAKALFETGSNTFAVTYSADYYLPELKHYAGSESRVYVDANRRDVDFQTDVQKVLRAQGC